MVAQVRRRQNFWRFLDIGWGRGRGGGAGNERTDILGNLSNLGQDAGSINREKEEEDEEKGCARPRIERIERVETRLTRKYIIKTRENRVFSTRGFRQRGQSGRGKNKGEQLFKCYRAKNTRRGGMIIRLFRVGGGKIER